MRGLRLACAQDLRKPTYFVAGKRQPPVYVTGVTNVAPPRPPHIKRAGAPHYISLSLPTKQKHMKKFIFFLVFCLYALNAQSQTWVEFSARGMYGARGFYNQNIIDDRDHNYLLSFNEASLLCGCLVSGIGPQIRYR